MLSKNKVKYIQSLSLKKFRDKHNVFVAEGEKLVSELLPFFEIDTLLFDSSLAEITIPQIENAVFDVPLQEIKKLSSLKTARPAIGVFKKKETELAASSVLNTLSLALDGVQDPGNLGTILRIADWFGISNVICSIDTVDVYNPKVVQATMGALARVQVHYVDLALFFQDIDIPVYGTYLEGENIYKAKLETPGVIMMGNEGKGIRHEMERYVSKKLLIPPYPVDAQNVESLNVGVATSIICSEFRRRQ